MRMNEIMKQKGIMIPEFPAENGNPRRGRIRKEMKIYSPSDWGDSIFSTVGLEVNYFEKKIEVPYRNDAICNKSFLGSFRRP